MSKTTLLTELLEAISNTQSFDKDCDDCDCSACTEQRRKIETKDYDTATLEAMENIVSLSELLSAYHDNTGKITDDIEEADRPLIIDEIDKRMKAMLSNATNRQLVLILSCVGKTQSILYKHLNKDFPYRWNVLTLSD